MNLSKVSVFLFVFLFSTTSAVLAKQSTPQQQNRQILVNESDLPPALLDEIRLKQEIKTYGEYAGLGKEIGIAVNEGLEAVTDQTAKFAKTNVGKFTMFLIAYKVVGTDFVQFLVGIPLLIVGTIIFIWSYYRNCITRRVLISKDKEGTKAWKIVEGNAYEKMTHAGFYAIFLFITSLIIFA